MSTAIGLDTSRQACPSEHSMANKLGRVAWGVSWWLLFRPTPRLMFRWRVLLLKLFGAQVTWESRIDSSVRIWAPWNLRIGRDSSIGHHVDVYNVGAIEIGDCATVSQYAYLCAASHDVSDPTMKLVTCPINIGNAAWICAQAYVGPGITVGEGSVVGARAVAVKNVEPWRVVVGNPARDIKKRELAT